MDKSIKNKFIFAKKIKITIWYFLSNIKPFKIK